MPEQYITKQAALSKFIFHPDLIVKIVMYPYIFFCYGKAYQTHIALVFGLLFQ